MSGHAQGVLAQLRKADDEPNVDVDENALCDATIESLREHANELDELRKDALECVDPALADTSHTLRHLADALDEGITDPDTLHEYLHTHQYHTVQEAADAYREADQ